MTPHLRLVKSDMRPGWKPKGRVEPITVLEVKAGRVVTHRALQAVRPAKTGGAR